MTRPGGNEARISFTRYGNACLASEVGRLPLPPIRTMVEKGRGVRDLNAPPSTAARSDRVRRLRVALGGTRTLFGGAHGAPTVGKLFHMEPEPRDAAPP